MKKIISLVLVIVMMFSLSSNVFAKITPELNKATVAAGELVTVKISSDKDLVGLGSIEYYVYFDHDRFDYYSLNSVPFGNQAIARQDKKGKWYVSIGDFDMSGNGKTYSKGVLAEMTFKAKEDIAESSLADFEILCKEANDVNFVSYKTTEDFIGSTVSLTVTPAVAKGYTAALSADQTKAVGETAEVSIDVGGSETTYNAYRYVLTYDTGKLTFNAPASQENVTVTDNNGTITVLGYGADKTCGTDKLALSFTAKAPGTAAVNLTSAHIDRSANANVQDAPAATIVDAETVITVSNYTVTLPEDFTGAETVAPGENYTFTANDKNYTYELTATMGGATVPVQDNGNGTFTIANVQGNLVVTMVSKTAKSFSVTVTGTGVSDVTAANTATYGTDYTFTVNKAAHFAYEVSATIGGTAFTPTLAEGKYTIAGASITGDIVLTVNKTQSEATMTFTGSGSADVNGGTEQVASIGQDFTFTINKAEGYTYTVKLGENELTAVNGVYTISNVSGDTTITVEKTADLKLNVEVTEYVKLGEAGSAWLVTAAATLPQDHVLAYNETPMFWSEQYQAYAYLVISAKTLDEVKAEAAAAIREANATATTIAYTGDVNGTNLIDINDAQLVWNIYNAKYVDFTATTMNMFLRADLNGDRQVNTTDAAAVVAKIK